MFSVTQYYTWLVVSQWQGQTIDVRVSINMASIICIRINEGLEVGGEPNGLD